MAVLYGVSAGPGDAKDLTIRAYECLRDVKFLAFAAAGEKESAVFPILEKAGIDLSGKELIFLSVPMSKDRKVLEKAQEQAAERIRSYILAGQDVAFPVLGDVSIYSSYQYIAGRLRKSGIETKSISGVPSFCAAAAAFAIGLSHREESLLIYPSSYDEAALRQAIAHRGTTILMKPGKNWEKIKEYIREEKKEVRLVEYLGGEAQRLYEGMHALPDRVPYLSLVILRSGESTGNSEEGPVKGHEKEAP